MKAKPLAMIAALLAVFAAILVMVSAAQAETITPTTPYPNVPANAEVCKLEQNAVDTAQVEYDFSADEYADGVKLEATQTISAEELHKLRIAMDQAGIVLNNAKYELAKCQNTAANPADKECVGLALELNRLIDELAWRKDLEAQRESDMKSKEKLAGRGEFYRKVYKTAIKDWKLAKLARVAVELKIEIQKAAIAQKNCKNVDRPAPKPTDKQTIPPVPESPAPVSPTPPEPTATATSDLIH
ncbi:hypothetical protein [Sphaerisporangium corydalis]|uniref:DUF5667 domain-containing protein n=1 Tax=Sphaerisporangium corydalis TaxID=1441875 RepID=A0ABV9EDC4_9ACTN|nr:hypothetical protein [Sphaerisporangium corydalis]